MTQIRQQRGTPSSDLGDDPIFGTARETRYFSLGRHALAAALRMLDVTSYARLLMPEYICRDVLASLHLTHVRPCWYPVGTDLAPAIDPADWPDADAVLAVDYFGFPQDMRPFRRYAERTGAYVIEDNAHGFLSRDETGAWLGLRGDIGLFSLRKTFLLGTGAALVVQNEKLVHVLGSQLPAEGPMPSWGVRLRRGLRTATGSRLPERLLADIARMIRRIRTGYAIPSPDGDAERVIPLSPAPSADLRTRLKTFDLTQEIKRRRALYGVVADDLRSADCDPVFEHLPEGTVPYGMPVYCDDLRRVERVAFRHACDVFRWPDLPDAIVASAPAHYHRLHVVNFL